MTGVALGRSWFALPLLDSCFFLRVGIDRGERGRGGGVCGSPCSRLDWCCGSLGPYWQWAVGFMRLPWCRRQVRCFLCKLMILLESSSKRAHRLLVQFLGAIGRNCG